MSDQTVTDTQWFPVGSLDEIPRRGARVVPTEGGEVALFRTADDRVFALANRCPHKGGPLAEGIVFDHKVSCPLHNWAIDLATGEAVAPDEGCAGRYDVMVEAGEVLLCLPKGG